MIKNSICTNIAIGWHKLFGKKFDREAWQAQRDQEAFEEDNGLIDIDDEVQTLILASRSDVACNVLDEEGNINSILFVPNNSRIVSINGDIVTTVKGSSTFIYKWERSDNQLYLQQVLNK